jgi:MFS transporter, PAT family, beta-lactamase induction signal transducer AmpG
MSILPIFTNRRIAVTLLFMFASSFPLPLTGTGGTFQAWLKDFGVDIKTIGLLALVGLPYNFKFLWAPLLDRFVPPFLGRRTGWIAVFLTLLIVTIAAMGFLDPSKEMNLVVVCAFAVAFFSASQDIVIDAYRVDLLRPEERGPGASMVMLGGRLAFLASGALALALTAVMPWKWVWVSMAACLVIGLATCLFAPSPEVPVKPPASLKQAVLDPFRQYFTRDGAVMILFFVVLFKLGDTLAAALLTPFLKELGFTNPDIAAVNKVFGLIASLAGGVLAGGAVSRLGVYRSLWVFGILQAASNFVFIGLALSGKSYPWMVASIVVEQFCGGMGTAAFVAYLIGLCDQRFSATQYAMLSSLSAIARTVLASVTGYLVESLGWPLFFFTTALCALPGLLLLSSLRRYETKAA